MPSIESASASRMRDNVSYWAAVSREIRAGRLEQQTPPHGRLWQSHDRPYVLQQDVVANVVNEVPPTVFNPHWMSGLAGIVATSSGRTPPRVYDSVHEGNGAFRRAVGEEVRNLQDVLWREVESAEGALRAERQAQDYVELFHSLNDPITEAFNERTPAVPTVIAASATKYMNVPDTDGPFSTWDEVKAAADSETYFISGDRRAGFFYTPWWAVQLMEGSGETPCRMPEVAGSGRQWLFQKRGVRTTLNKVWPQSSVEIVTGDSNGDAISSLLYADAVSGRDGMYLWEASQRWDLFSRHNMLRFAESGIEEKLGEDFINFTANLRLPDGLANRGTQYNTQYRDHALDDIYKRFTDGTTADALATSPVDVGRFPQATVLGPLRPEYNSMTEELTSGPLAYSMAGEDGVFILTPKMNRMNGIGNLLLLKALQNGHRQFVVKNDAEGIVKGLPFLMKRGAKIQGATGDGEFVVLTIRVGGE